MPSLLAPGQQRKRQGCGLSGMGPCPKVQHSLTGPCDQRVVRPELRRHAEPAELSVLPLGGPHEIRHLEKAVRDDVEEYVHFARNMGFYAEARHGIGIDAVSTIERLCAGAASDYPHATFFAGKLIFGRPSFFTRFLHNQTVAKIEEALQLRGFHTVVLPLVATP